jgi:hypothetical protein
MGTEDWLCKFSMIEICVSRWIPFLRLGAMRYTNFCARAEGQAPGNCQLHLNQEKSIREGYNKLKEFGWSSYVEKEHCSNSDGSLSS